METEIRLNEQRTVEVTLDLCFVVPDEHFDKLRILSYRYCDIALVCFDLSDIDTFKHLSTQWKPELDHHCPDVMRILVGLKCDLEIDARWLNNNDILVYGYIHSLNYLDLHIVSDIIEIILDYFPSRKNMDVAAEMTNGNYVKYMEVSSLKRINIEEVFTTAIVEFLNAKHNANGIDHTGCNCIML